MNNDQLSAVMGYVDGVVFSLDHLFINGWAYDKKSGQRPSIKVLLNGKTLDVPPQPVERADVARTINIDQTKTGFKFAIPYEKLFNEASFKIEVVDGSADVNERRIHNSAIEKSEKLDLFADPTAKKIHYHVIDASTRGLDLYDQLFCARFFYRRKEYPVLLRAGCLCVHGYRLIDLDWASDADFQRYAEEFFFGAEETLDEIHSLDPFSEKVARWITSVRLCRAWVNTRLRKWREAEVDFEVILDHLHHIAQEPRLILTLTHSAFMCAYFAMKRGDTEKAKRLFHRVTNVVQIALPLYRFGRYFPEYNDIIYGMVAARNAHYLRMKLLAAEGGEFRPVELPPHDSLDMGAMLRPIPRLNQLGCFEREVSSNDTI